MMSIRIIYRYIFILAFWISISEVNGQFSELKKAQKYYEQNSYNDALQVYTKYINSGYADANLYHNVANCFFQLGETGKAVLWYEKALKLKHNDNATLKDYDIVKNKIQDYIPELKPFFLFKWWNSFVKLNSSNNWAVLGIISFWISISVLIYTIWFKVINWKLKLYSVSTISFVLSILFTILSVIKFNDENNVRFGIVMSKSVQFKSLPDEEGSVIFDLKEGNKVEVLDKVADWLKVRLQNGEEGWILSNTIEKI